MSVDKTGLLLIAQLNPLGAKISGGIFPSSALLCTLTRPTLVADFSGIRAALATNFDDQSLGSE